ncbi:MAG: phosphodiester glycosidase family protein, partial [Muribaculaceae bacterium]|nr:phosphodiester glycosidase family protein [Muribaculaceae bacterium]
STVVNNEIYNLSNNGWTSWAMVNGKTPVANEMSFTGTVSSGSASCNLSGVNVDRYADYLVIYTQRKSNNTGTNVYGYEVALEPISGKTVMFGKSTFKVTSAPSSAGSMAIPAGQVVLSGNGAAATFVSSLNIGDEVTVDISLVNGSEKYSDVSQMAGGKPMIVSGGKVLDTQGALDHLVALNPRTAIGYDVTGTKLVLLVVDGRGVSAGVVSRQLADMMIELGCSEAMNFDGGGSSALYVQGLGVRNSPSDGSERSVTNGVYAVAVAPVDNTVAALEFEQKKISLPRYCYYAPRVYAYNKYGVLIDTDYKGYTLSCDPELGSITADGKQLFTAGSGKHTLTAEVNDVTASVTVEVSAADPRMRLSSVVVDSYNPYTTEVVASVDGKDIPVDNGAITWSSDNTAVATVDAAGVINGVAEGTATISGTVDDVAMQIPVTVEIPQTRYRNVFTSETTFGNAKSGTKDITVTNTGEGSFTVDFTISSTRSPYLEVQAEAISYAIPDSLKLQINPGTATIKSVYVGYYNAEGRKATKTYNVEFPNDEISELMLPLSDLIDPSDRGNFPLKLTGLRFYFNNANASTHHITVPAYSFVYDNVKDTEGVEAVTADDASDNLVFSANPVAAGEAVEVSAEGKISVFNLAGELVVQTEGSSFNAPSQPGMYIVRVNESTGKLIVR